MRKKIFTIILNLLSKIASKRILYVPQHRRDDQTISAVKSKYGFWYCGDIFEQSDIAYGVLSNGTVEPYDTEIVKSILLQLPKDYTFYDVGSNTGWYTMLATSTSSEANVYSFEPIAEHINCQKETIALNRKESHVTIFDIALSDHNGQETIRLAGSGTSLENDFLTHDFGKRVIHVKTLDSLVLEKGLKKPDFIKIDVEGYEYKVLQGAIKTISSNHPVLFIEIAKTFSSRNFINKDYEKIFALLAKNEYIPYLVMDGAIKEFNPSMSLDGVAMFLFLNKKNHLGKENFIPSLQKVV